MHLSKHEIFHSYEKLESFSHFLAFLINHLVCRAKKCRFIWLSDRLEPELRDRCNWEKFVTVADFKRHGNIWLQSCELFGWIEKSENTVVYLPLLIDKRSIKFTDTCIIDLLRMMHDLSKKAYQNVENSALLCRSVLIISAQAWMNFHFVISQFAFFSNMSDFKTIRKVIICANTPQQSSLTRSLSSS